MTIRMKMPKGNDLGYLEELTERRIQEDKNRPEASEIVRLLEGIPVKEYDSHVSRYSHRIEIKQLKDYSKLVKKLKLKSHEEKLFRCGTRLCAEYKGWSLRYTPDSDEEDYLFHG
jgi:hypothetical protein